MAKISKSNGHKPTEQQIAERARQIYEASGRIPGRDLENWLEAEAQLTATTSTSTVARTRPQVKNSQVLVSRSAV